MEKSYVDEGSLTITMKIKLDQVEHLIVELDETEEDAATNSYRVKALVTELKKLKRSAVEEAHRRLERMLESQ
jgi:uncharacterized protein YbaP (TraB family)